MKILLHTCCGPCTTYVHEWLKDQGFGVTGFFYNPNIHPYKEFQRRLEALKSYAEKSKLPMIYDENYDLEEFLRRVMDKGERRCYECYQLRLEKTAQRAKKEGFSLFTTTLLISPYQKHEWAKEIGEKLTEKKRLEFFYHDFREGYQESIKLSRDFELYRQSYCGCIFSEKERYA